MDSEGQTTETPDTFLNELVEELRCDEGIDTDLTNIMAIHILTISPTRDAATLAKTAILQLAAERAVSRGSEVQDGE